jgi:1-acyl-sn-glycerol-3-phosphate acyltransferase
MLEHLAGFCLRLFGWQAIGALPSVRKMVLLGYPHTSSWDLLVYVLVAWRFGISLSWMGKEELFRGASGVLMRALNGIAVRRGRRENVVQQMARVFAERDELYLLIAPEGTRKRVDYLKSGFYQIARAANVPICPCFVDYERKRSGIGPLVYPSGDVKKDMDAIRAFYQENAVGRHPELTGRFRLPEEDEN